MRNESFTASCLAILFMSATFFAALLYLPQFMQKQLGYSPLEAGVGMLPFLATFALVSFVAGPLYNRLGAKPLVTLGAACITVGAVHLLPRRPDSGYDSLIAGMVVLGIGIGSFYPTATTAGVTSVDESQTSLAGGIIYMFQIAGGSIGLGLTTTVFSSQIPPFVDGIQAAFRLDAALSLVGLLSRCSSSAAGCCRGAPADAGLSHLIRRRAGSWWSRSTRSRRRGRSCRSPPRTGRCRCRRSVVVAAAAEEQVRAARAR